MYVGTYEPGIRNVKSINVKFYSMRCLVMFITAVCLLFLLKICVLDLRWRCFVDFSCGDAVFVNFFCGVAVFRTPPPPMSPSFKNVSSVYESSQHYPLKENIDLTVITFSTRILKWKGVFYFQMYLVFSYLKENTHLSMITFLFTLSRKTLCLFGEHWYHVLFLLHCYYTTRRICGIKQVIIVAFFCWLPIMFTLFPSLAIPSFIHFLYWGITFTQCATKRPAINCHYKHQSSSLLLVLLFLKLTSQHFTCYKQLLVDISFFFVCLFICLVTF